MKERAGGCNLLPAIPELPGHQTARPRPPPPGRRKEMGTNRREDAAARPRALAAAALAAAATGIEGAVEGIPDGADDGVWARGEEEAEVAQQHRGEVAHEQVNNLVPDWGRVAPGLVEVGALLLG